MQRLENKVDNVLDESFDIFQNYFYEHILKLPPKLDIPLEHHKVHHEALLQRTNSLLTRIWNL